MGAGYITAFWALAAYDKQSDVWLSPWKFGIEALKMVIKTIKELMEQRSEKGDSARTMGTWRPTFPQSASLPNLFFSNQLVIPLIHQTIKSQTFLN